MPYLVQKYGKDDSLYPSDLKKRGTVDARLHFDNGILFNHLLACAVSLCNTITIIFGNYFLNCEIYLSNKIKSIYCYLLVLKDLIFVQQDVMLCDLTDRNNVKSFII